MGAGALLQTRRWRPGPANICSRREPDFTILFSCSCLFSSRWEVPIDGVMLDGQQLPASSLLRSGSVISALIDTGNSLIRGPKDVVDAVLKQVSPAFAANPNADPTFPCAVPHELAFQIGGKTFPIDPRDFMSQYTPGDARTCISSSIFMTDPPSHGGYLAGDWGTHSSNRILSIVPANASSIVQSIVSQAQANGRNFESTSQAAPTNVATNVLLETTSVQFRTIAPSSSSSSSKPDISSALPTFGGPTNVGLASALCTILIFHFLWNDPFVVIEHHLRVPLFIYY